MPLIRCLVLLVWYVFWITPSWSQKAKIENLHAVIDEVSKTVKISYDLVGNTKATVVKLTIYRADSTVIAAPTMRGVKEAILSPHRSKVVYWDVVADAVYANEKFRFELQPEEMGKVYKPILHWTARGVAVGGGVGSWLIWSQFKTKLTQLNALSPKVDPDADGVIQDAALYSQWHDQYTQTQQASKQAYFYAGIGVAAAATIFEIYMLLQDAKTHQKVISLAPSTSGLGVGIYYRFASKR